MKDEDMVNSTVTIPTHPTEAEVTEAREALGLRPKPKYKFKRGLKRVGHEDKWF